MIGFTTFNVRTGEQFSGFDSFIILTLTEEEYSNFLDFLSFQCWNVLTCWHAIMTLDLSEYVLLRIGKVQVLVWKKKRTFAALTVCWFIIISSRCHIHHIQGSIKHSKCTFSTYGHSLSRLIQTLLSFVHYSLPVMDISLDRMFTQVHSSRTIVVVSGFWKETDLCCCCPLELVFWWW